MYLRPIRTYCGIGYLLLGAAACMQGTIGGGPIANNNGEDIPKFACSLDPSSDFSTAYEITEADIQNAAKMSESICPTYDEDFWHVALSGERLLVDISCSLQETGATALAMDWLGPKGICVPEPTTPCTDDSACISGICDSFRNVCRVAAPLECYRTEHCAATETCLIAEATRFYDPITDNYFPNSSIHENMITASIHEIETSFPAFIPGDNLDPQAPTDFYLRVYDAENNAHKNFYEFTLGYHIDPDINEPNNSQHMATPINADTEITGYLSYNNDVDWYVLLPDPSTEPVIAEVDLQWASSTVSIQPVWTMIQDERSYEAPSIGTNQLKTAYILNNRTPIYFRVQNTNRVVDRESPYTLNVVLKDDTIEEGFGENKRNDTAIQAWPLAIGSPGASTNFSDSLIARNDRDWYKLERTATNDNTIVYLTVSTPAGLRDPEQSLDVSYLMLMRVYLPTGQSCETNSDCSADQVCELSLNECLKWLQRPRIFNLFGEQGSVQYGGPPDRRNNQYAQFPVQSNDGVYVLIQHISNNIYELPGYSDTLSYTLNALHIVEDDAGDKTNADNHFVPRPLENEAGRSSFYRRSRTTNYPNTGESIYDPGVGSGKAFVMLTSLDAVETSTCVPLSFMLYDQYGENQVGPGTNTTISVNEGALFLTDTCSQAQPVPQPLSNPILLPGSPVFYEAPATIPTSGYVTFTINGYDFYKPIFDTNTPAMPRIDLSGSHSAVMGGYSAEVTATVPSGEVILNLQITDGTGSILCRTGTQTTCQNVIANDSSYCTDTAGDSSCNLIIQSTESTASFHMQPADSSALIVVKVSDTQNTHVPGTWIFAAFEAATFDFNNSKMSGRGFISYEGDWDFFSIQLPDSFPKGHLALSVTSGNVDIRINVVRASSSDGWSNCGVGIDNNGPCTPCEINASSQCIYQDCEGDYLNVTVADYQYDDWDLITPYTFEIGITEGCPDICNQYVCGGGD